MTQELLLFSMIHWSTMKEQTNQMLKFGWEPIGDSLQSPKESQTLTDMAASSETSYPTSFIFIDEKIKLRKVKWLLQSHSAGWWNRGISNSLFFWLWVPIASCPESTHGFLKSFSALPGRPNSACYLFLQIKFY